MPISDWSSDLCSSDLGDVFLSFRPAWLDDDEDDDEGEQPGDSDAGADLSIGRQSFARKSKKYRLSVREGQMWVGPKQAQGEIDSRSGMVGTASILARSEERRVGQECVSTCRSG